MVEEARGKSGRQAVQQRIVDLNLKAVRIGQAQRSGFWIALCASQALLDVAVSTGVSRPSSEAAVAAFLLAKPALKRCKPLIPEHWARTVEGLLPQVAAVLPVVETRLRLLQAGGDSSAARATLQAMAQVAQAARAASQSTAICTKSVVMAAARWHLACAAVRAAIRRSTAGEWRRACWVGSGRVELLWQEGDKWREWTT